MNPRLAIAIVCLAIAGYILGFWSEAFGESFYDSRTPMHFGASAGIGFMTGVATQKIDDQTTRRATAIGVCMIPGAIKEETDAEVSGADLFWDLAGCGAGVMLFEGVNVLITDKSISVAGRW